MAYTNADDTISLESLVGPMMIDCPYPIAEQGLRLAAIEFCERTKCYANIQTKTVGNGIQSVLLSPTDDALIADIILVEWNGKPIDPITKQRADEIRLRSSTGVPEGYYRPNPEALVLAPAPESAGTLMVEMSLTPTKTAGSIPKFLSDYHGDAIEHGAKARLLAQTNRPWADANLAAYHKQQFEILVGSYSIRADKDGTRRPLRVKSSF
jgi:hypothetical protein